MHERGPAEPRDLAFVEAEYACRVCGEGRTATAVPDHVRRLEVDEIGGDCERVVDRVSLEQAARLGLEGEHGIPGLGRAEPFEPVEPVLDEQVGERRVVGAVAAVAGRVDGALR